MKKKVIYLSIIIILLVVGTVFLLKRNNCKKVAIYQFDLQGNKFELCKTYVYSESENYIFVPKYESELLQEIVEKKEYVGMRQTSFLAADYKECYIFMNLDAAFALINDEGTFSLKLCSTTYTVNNGNVYSYISPGNWFPDNSNEADLNQSSFKGEFDDFFGDFQYAVDTFYKYFSEKNVTIDYESQQITSSVFNFYTGERIPDRNILIDFNNKSVREVMVD